MADEPIPAPITTDKPADTPPAVKDTPEPKPAEKPATTLLGAPDEPETPPEPAKDEPKKEGEPDATPIDIKVPEGFATDEVALGDFKAFAKEAGLTGESAQKVFDFYVKTENARAEAEKAQQRQWESEIKADPQHKTMIATAKRALVKLGDPDARALIEGSLLGSNPSIIRLLAKAGELLREDKVIEGDPPPAKTSFYDHTPG